MGIHAPLHAQSVGCVVGLLPSWGSPRPLHTLPSIATLVLRMCRPYGLLQLVPHQSQAQHRPGLSTAPSDLSLDLSLSLSLGWSPSFLVSVSSQSSLVSVSSRSWPRSVSSGSSRVSKVSRSTRPARISRLQEMGICPQQHRIQQPDARLARSKQDEHATGTTRHTKEQFCHATWLSRIYARIMDETAELL